jgi:two-component system sensor histidine kinase UhpB
MKGGAVIVEVGTVDARDEPRRGWLIARPLGLLISLDAAGVALAAAAVAQVADPDILLHVVWIVLAVEAFAFGIRVAAVRIVAATVLVATYAMVARGDATPLAAGMIDLDLEEWPLMAIIAIVVAVMAERVQHTGRRYAALYRAASDRLLTAQEDERKRLAADLHDGVGQTMTALALTLDAAATALDGQEPPAVRGRDAVRRAREMTTRALDDVRGVAFRLRPARLTETGLVAGLSELAATAGLPVEFFADPALARPGLLDPVAEVEVYRVVQEALGNAARHAQASAVRISVRRAARQLRVEVSDDGVGFDTRRAPGRGLGLASMHDRASVIGATLRVDSRPGDGTVVRLDVPLVDGVPTASAADTSGRAEAGAVGL